MGEKAVKSEGKKPVPQAHIRVSTWLRVAFIVFILPGAILFGSAGTFRWPMAWLFLGLTGLSFIVSRLLVWRKHPDLLEERGRMMNHEDAAPYDRVLAPLLALAGPTLIEVVAGLALRFGWQPVFSVRAEWAGVGIFLLGTLFGSWALLANPFFSGVVRIQKERGHHVITSGPYALVRHPGYLGACVSYAGMVLMLGSAWAFIPFALQQGVLVVRTALEDKTLQQELPGYTQYTQQTPFRLIPGIW